MSISDFYTSGRIADIVIAFLVLEAIALGLLMRRSPALPQLLAGLAAGLCLVLALRAALTNAGWRSLALFLTLSFLAHVIELGLAWRRR
jgi:flagellar biosynthesis protein FliR